MKRPVLKLCRCAAAVLFAALLAALFAGCIRIGDTDSDKQSPAGKTDRYVWQNSHGDKLSAAPGYAHISVTKSLDAAGRNVAVRIPTIFAYTDAAFSMGAESTENGFCELVFSYGGYTDTAFVKTYAEALDGCGFSLEKTWVLDDKQTIYYLNDRNGGITRGADDFLGTKYDLSITVFHSVSTTSLIFAYPPEVGFDTDAADAVYTTLELAVDYAAENGKDIFRIGGWGDSAKDQIVLSIDGGRYQTGDILQKADFAAQANAGANALCSIAIWGSTISRDSAGWPVYIESLDDVTVTVLARSGGVLAIAYAIDAPSGSAHYKLEGVCAAATDDGRCGGKRRDLRAVQAEQKLHPLPRQRQGQVHALQRRHLQHLPHLRRRWAGAMHALPRRGTVLRKRRDEHLLGLLRTRHQEVHVLHRRQGHLYKLPRARHRHLPLLSRARQITKTTYKNPRGATNTSVCTRGFLFYKSTVRCVCPQARLHSHCG